MAAAKPIWFYLCVSLFVVCGASHCSLYHNVPPKCSQAMQLYHNNSHDTLASLSFDQIEAFNRLYICSNPMHLSQATTYDQFIEEETYRRRTAVISSIKHVWKSYESTAMGAGEIHPVTGLRATAAWGNVPVMIIDNLDTLYYAGMHDEFQRGIDFLTEEYTSNDNVEKIAFSYELDVAVNVFETLIRQLGGLLSAYVLSGQRKLLDLASDLTDRLLGSFSLEKVHPVTAISECIRAYNEAGHSNSISDTKDWKSDLFLCAKKQHSNPIEDIINVCQLLTPELQYTRLSFNYINLKSRRVLGDTSKHSIAEAGTHQLEFKTLAELTGNCTYSEVVDSFNEFVEKMYNVSIIGIVPTHTYMAAPKHGYLNEAGVGAESDSYYEYVIKEWLMTGERDPLLQSQLEAFLKQIRLFIASKKLLPSNQFGYVVSWTGQIGETLGGISFKDQLNFLTFVDMKNKITLKTKPYMEHLMCFLPGTLAALLMSKKAETIITVKEMRQDILEFAEDIAKGCAAMYFATLSGLGPETFDLRDNTPGEFQRSFLRPEALEGMFLLYRLTKNPKYQNWAWRMFSAIEANAKVQFGYTSMNRINTLQPVPADEQHTFVMSETLKYLLFMYSEDSALDLQKFVFNTEAHPLPILKDGGHCGRTSRLKRLLNETKPESPFQQCARKLYNFEVPN